MTHELTVDRWLVIDERGSTRLTARYPSLQPDEIAMLLSIKVPMAIFRKPMLSAKITVPAEAGSPSEIAAVVVADMKSAIEQATGLRVTLTVVNKEEIDAGQPQS